MFLPIVHLSLAAQDSTTARSAAARDTTQYEPSASTPIPAKPRHTGKAHKRKHPRHTVRHTAPSASADSAMAARWPVHGPAPLPGSLLPAHRIVAFYGNPLSRRMGILGELPPTEMLAKLDQEVAAWQRADSSVKVVPALHLIAVVAQGGPGRDGKYRLRMDSSLIERVYSWARQRNALLFLDVQVGQSTVQAELPRLTPFLKRPDVHLALDPEFSMHYDKEGVVPGRKIGTMDAADVDYAAQLLETIVSANGLPPKVLIVHRFTTKMLRGLDRIRLDPRVQVVIDMDGFGPPWMKADSYHDYVFADPVQFTGWKQFYKNDRPRTQIEDILKLRPKPLYIQYQ
jgi:hypothetical protein